LEIPVAQIVIRLLPSRINPHAATLQDRLSPGDEHHLVFDQQDELKRVERSLEDLVQGPTIKPKLERREGRILGIAKLEPDWQSKVLAKPAR
jgi:hypothetical protein